MACVQVGTAVYIMMLLMRAAFVQQGKHLASISGVQPSPKWVCTDKITFSRAHKSLKFQLN